MTSFGAHIISGFIGTSVSETMLEAIRRGELGGVIWFTRNIESMDQLRRENERIANAVPSSVRDFVIGVDQEGGRVQRLGTPFLQVPSMQTLGARAEVAETYDWAYRQSQALVGLGFNLNFAPVLDIFSNPHNRVIGDRAFGADPDSVIAHARAYAQGMLAAGIAPCGKHFPGHGDTLTDSHHGLPHVHHSRKRLQAVELRPFQTLIAEGLLPYIMTAHIVCHAFDARHPATLSKACLQGVLRDDLGFKGCIVSDDLEMGALHGLGDLARVAKRALEAGCDKLLICSDFEVSKRVVEAFDGPC